MLIVASAVSSGILEPRQPRELTGAPVTTRPASFAGVAVISIHEIPGGPSLRTHRDGSLAKRAIARTAADKNGQLSWGGGLPHASAIDSILSSSGFVRRYQQGTTSPVGSLVARGSLKLL